MRTKLFIGLLALTLGARAHAQTAPAASASPTLDAIRARGQLVCGVAGNTAGLSLPDSQGVMRGLDADTCRTIAAAVLGDAAKVRFVPTTTVSRFTALQSGEVDMLSRSTTWSAGREANLGLAFASINFYDGTGFIVKAASGIKTATELNGATICIQSGSTTELAVGDFFRVHNMSFTPILMSDLPELRGAYLTGRCDAFSNDASGVASFRWEQGPRAVEHVVLPDVISKEPLGAVVRKGDDRFFDVVRWTHFATLIAEEHGLNSGNVDQALSSTDPEVRRLMGLEGDLGKSFGLDNRFAYNVVKQVGNFAEIWDRNITPMGLPRGPNQLWNKGGLQYAPPFR